ncbi:hypothetical protein PYH71_13230 (plasmid) [Staphylococcus delphini]|uniref:hypothetical protein n=1 Tax=Staphylococcus delphini TaxID=53344 RepID=UPI003364C199
MIHVMNFKGEIVDFISHSDNAVIQAVHNRNINERMETFDFTILSERTTHFQERNRIIIQDKNGLKIVEDEEKAILKLESTMDTKEAYKRFMDSRVDKSHLTKYPQSVEPSDYYKFLESVSTWS